MLKKKKVPERKLKEVQLLKDYMDEYDVIGLVSMEKIGAKAVQELRKKLRGKVVMRMAKKRLMKRALKKCDKPNIEKLGDYIKGSTALLFTNMNPIKLSQFLEDNSAKAPAKPGDKTPIEITIKKGNTRIPPGPVISELNTHLDLPTMIKDGMIHIREDTVTHEPGDEINAKQAMLLNQLGIEPMTVVLDFYCAYEDGSILPEEVLKLDQEKIISNVQSGYATAFTLAMALNVISEETIEPMVLKAAQAANAVALDCEIITPDTIPMFLSKAASSAASINTMVYGGDEEKAVADEDAKKDEAEEKEEEKDDDEVMGAGIGALFG